MRKNPRSARRLLALSSLLTLSLALPLAAQPGPPGGGSGGGPGGPGGPPPEQVLKDVLGFSDAQVTAFRTLSENHRQAVETLHQQIGEASRALQEAVRAASPNPTQIGTLFLAVNNLQKQFPQIEEAYHNGFAAILTSQQTARVGEIKALQATLQAGEALRRLGVL